VTNPRTFYRRAGARVALVLIWGGALASALVLHHSGAWFQSAGALCGLGLALGGAAGNLLDILRRRHVVDFIDLGWWPVFNVADVAIVAGLALAFWPAS
jgi:signal peptidase II